MRTLLIIDLQKGFIKEESKDIPKKIRSYIQKEKYDFILFSKFINKQNTNFVKLLHWKKCFAEPEIDIVPELSEYAKSDTVFEKNTYSIFKSEKFLEFLKEKNITKMDICGLESDGCVLASAYEGFDLGYEMIVLRELMRSTTSLNKATEEIINRNIHRVYE
ncbi:MAG: isochorismatase family cysteine hydrolase [Candidatus Gracilibacteria bacterium]